MVTAAGRSPSEEERGCTTDACRVLTYVARLPEFPFCPQCGFIGVRATSPYSDPTGKTPARVQS
jgi:hypothetical protein